MRTRAKQNYLLVERLMVVQDAIENGNYPSITSLRKKVLDRLGADVSIPTLRRDLDFLRSRIGIDIRYDTYRQGYYIEPAVSN